MYCSDPWYREATVEFLDYYLELSHYDQLVVPGGGANILLSSFSFVIDRNRVKILDMLHSFKRVISIAHYNCAFYRLKYPTLKEEDIPKKQEDDLGILVAELHKLVPMVEVEIYLGMEVAGKVNFYRIQR